MNVHVHLGRRRAWWQAHVSAQLPACLPTGADCRLTVQAISSERPDMARRGLPIESGSSCDWRLLGLQPKAHSPNNVDFEPWVSVSKPRYSVLRTKAEVETGGEWVSLGGNGERCVYRRTLTGGWRRIQCATTWIS